MIQRIHCRDMASLSVDDREICSCTEIDRYADVERYGLIIDGNIIERKANMVEICPHNRGAVLVKHAKASIKAGHGPT